MIFTIIISTISILFFISIYVILNLLKKQQKLEDIVEYQNNYIIDIDKIISESKSYMKELDTLGAFKSDDEVGRFFDFMQEIQTTLEKVSNYEEKNK